MYVYRDSDSEVFTVGFYDPNGKWLPESDHLLEDVAADRVAWLNGVPTEHRLQQLIDERFEAFFSKREREQNVKDAVKQAMDEYFKKAADLSVNLVKLPHRNVYQDKNGMLIHGPEYDTRDNGITHQIKINTNQFDKPFNNDEQ
jgi:hypothetical protein